MPSLVSSGSQGSAGPPSAKPRVVPCFGGSSGRLPDGAGGSPPAPSRLPPGWSVWMRCLSSFAMSPPRPGLPGRRQHPKPGAGSSHELRVELRVGGALGTEEEDAAPLLQPERRATEGLADSEQQAGQAGNGALAGDNLRVALRQ